MTNEEVGMSIVEAVTKRFSGLSPGHLLQGLLLAQEIERADIGYTRRGLA